MWLLSGGILPIIILVIIPLVVTILSYGIDQQSIYYILGYEIVPIDILYIPVFAYAIYPIIYSSKKYFEKRGVKNALIEYEYIKKILYIIIPVFIIATMIDKFFLPAIFDLVFPSNPENILRGRFDTFRESRERLLNYNYFKESLYETYYLIPIGVNLGYTVIAGIIRMAIHFARKDFRYYLANACFSIASCDTDEIMKANCLVMGIKSYDKYLQRSVNLQMNDIKRIYSKILLPDATVNRNEIIRSVSAAFQSSDKLKPAKNLARILKDEERENFLIDQSVIQKIKDSAIFLATIIPVVIAIVELLLPSKNN